MSKLTKEAVLRALENVDDPVSGKNIVSQDMVKDVHISGKKVAVTIQLTKEASEMRSAIKKAAESSIKIFAGDAEVMINIQSPEPPPMTKTTNPMMAGQLDALPNVKQIIAVASGKGGVGKSTVAVNLAIGLAEGGAKVGLLDADIYGPSAPIMFGIQGERPMMRNDGAKGKIVPIEKYGVKVMSIGLLVDEKQAMIWRGPMATSALKQFVSDVDWGELDYLVLDLPPGTGDIHLTVVQTLPIAGAVIVTTPQTVAMADAKKGIMMFKQGSIEVPILGIVENMSYFTPAELPENKYYLFGKNGGKHLAEQFDLPFLAEIPIVQSIRQGGDQGVPAILDDDAVAKPRFIALAERVKSQLKNISVGKTLTQNFEA